MNYPLSLPFRLCLLIISNSPDHPVSKILTYVGNQSHSSSVSPQMENRAVVQCWRVMG